MNSVALVGRITRDPEIRYTGEGFAIGHFTVAVDRDRKEKNGERKADFFPVVVFGKTAENVERIYKKGHRVEVLGRLENDEWTTQDGEKRTKTQIVANHTRTLEPKSQSQQQPEAFEPWDAGAFTF